MQHKVQHALIQQKRLVRGRQAQRNRGNGACRALGGFHWRPLWSRWWQQWRRLRLTQREAHKLHHGQRHEKVPVRAVPVR